MQRYASGETGKIPLSVIEKLADLFGVSSEYLMGWDEKERTPSEPVLTEGEKELLELFRLVPEDNQPLVIQMIKVAIDNLR